jgi:hypothetical protein
MLNDSSILNDINIIKIFEIGDLIDVYDKSLRDPIAFPFVNFEEIQSLKHNDCIKIGNGSDRFWIRIVDISKDPESILDTTFMGVILNRLHVRKFATYHEIDNKNNVLIRSSHGEYNAFDWVSCNARNIYEIMTEEDRRSMNGKSQNINPDNIYRV